MVNINCWVNSDLKLCCFKVVLRSGFRAPWQAKYQLFLTRYNTSLLAHGYAFVTCEIRSIIYCWSADFCHDQAFRVVLTALWSVPTDRLWNYLVGRWRFLSLTSTLRQGLKSLTSTFSLAATSLGMWLGLPYVSVLHILHWIYTVNLLLVTKLPRMTWLSTPHFLLLPHPSISMSQGGSVTLMHSWGWGMHLF